MNRATSLLVILAAGACARTPAPEAGELRVIPLGGDVRILDGGESSLLGEATTVDTGVGVSTGGAGRAEIQLPGGPRFELAPGTLVRLDGGGSEVSKGSVLVRTPAPLMVRAGGAEIEADDAVFRLENGVSVLLAMYRGQASVLGSGAQPVPALRQATLLPGGEIAEGIQPLEVDANNPWDVELLGAAIDLGRDLLDLERGLSRQLPRGREGDAVSAVLEREFSPRDIDAAIRSLGNAASAVVAAAVAQQAMRMDGGSGSLRAVLGSVIELQRETASWIIVVAEWGLAQVAAALIAELKELAGAVADLVAPQPAPPSEASSAFGPGDQGSDGNAPVDDGGDGGGNGTNGGRNDTSNQPPEAPPPEDPGDGNAGPECSTLECQVEDILEEGPAPPSAPSTLP